MWSRSWLSLKSLEPEPLYILVIGAVPNLLNKKDIFVPFFEGGSPIVVEAESLRAIYYLEPGSMTAEAATDTWHEVMVPAVGAEILKA